MSLPLNNNREKRTHFLQNIWKAYPTLECGRGESFFGEVVQKQNQSLTIRGAEESKVVQSDDLEAQEHKHWGESVPYSVLQEGDWVGWDSSSRGLFLFAPCLVEMKRVEGRDPLSWGEFLNKVHQFFKDHGFQEMKTPFLVPSPGVDHHIDYLEVTATQTKRQWTLPTSPEIHLKKYLCQGYQKIYEIKSCFRDDLPSPVHSVEFSMLEWYRSFANLDDIYEDLRKLLHYLHPQAPTVKRCSLSEAFKEWTGFELQASTSLSELQSWAQALSVETAQDDDWNDVFFRIMLEKVEPYLGQDGPLVVTHFPSHQASLAQIDGDGWACRMELYWQGVELANAYLEVNDPEENRVRFQEEQKKRGFKGVSVATMDEDFFEYLKQGMPPAAGIALGMDRLYQVIKRKA